MNKEKIIKILEDYEYFVDDDYGGHYENINCSQKALTPLGILNILDYIDELQQENKKLKEKYKATNKGLIKVLSKRLKWKRRYYKEKYIKKELKKWLEEIQQEEFDINGFKGVCTEIRIQCILDKIKELEDETHDVEDFKKWNEKVDINIYYEVKELEEGVK